MASTLAHSFVAADLPEDESYHTSASTKLPSMSGMKFLGRGSTSSVTYVVVSDYNSNRFRDYTQSILITGTEYFEPLSIEAICGEEYPAMRSKQPIRNGTVAARVTFAGKTEAVDTSSIGSLILEDAATVNPLRKSRVVMARVTVVHGAPGKSGAEPQ